MTPGRHERPSRDFVPVLRGVASAAMALFMLACGGEHPQSSIDPMTDLAESIHGLYRLIFVITLAILVVVWGALAYILVRFRARPDAPLPRQTHGHLGMELAWTIVPSIIVVVIAIPTIQTVFATQRPVDGGALTVDVIGHQFWWEFRYPDGVVTAGELHLPVNRPISLRMQSADVIHSFWVPMLGGKRDVNPQVAEPPLEEGSDAVAVEGQDFNYLHFTIREPGVYRGQCSEFCGQSHAMMGVRVVAESEADFNAWLADWNAAPAASASPGAGAGPTGGADPAAGATPQNERAALIELGRQTFHASACLACHAIQGTNAVGRLGPNLTLLGRRSSLVGWLDNNPENLARWITAPQSIKPGAKMPGVAEGGGDFPPTNLSEEQVRAVAEYLYSLGRVLSIRIEEAP